MPNDDHEFEVLNIRYKLYGILMVSLTAVKWLPKKCMTTLIENRLYMDNSLKDAYDNLHDL